MNKIKKTYTGCFWVWTSEFSELRDWLNPGKTSENIFVEEF
jgi:hypothetical protein